MNKQENTKIPIEVEFTDGYEERFTKAILKICTNRLRKAEQEEISYEEPQVS